MNLLLVCNFAVVSTATNREHNMHKRFYGRPTFLPLFCEPKVVLSLFVTCRNQRLMEYLPLAFVHLLLLETEARCRRGEGITHSRGAEDQRECPFQLCRLSCLTCCCEAERPGRKWPTPDRSGVGAEPTRLKERSTSSSVLLLNSLISAVKHSAAPVPLCSRLL